MHGRFRKNKNVPFVDTSVVTDMKWGEEGRRRPCFTAPFYYLCDSRPNSHRTTGKSLPEGGRQWVTVYTVSTHECCWNTAHTNTVAHVRLEQKLRGEKADYNNGWCEDISGLGSLVRWLSHYLNTKQKKTKYCSSSNIWKHLEPHLAGHILHNLANSVFTNIPW